MLWPACSILHNFMWPCKNEREGENYCHKDNIKPAWWNINTQNQSINGNLWPAERISAEREREEHVININRAMESGFSSHRIFSLSLYTFIVSYDDDDDDIGWTAIIAKRKSIYMWREGQWSWAGRDPPQLLHQLHSHLMYRCCTCDH